jgi:nucleotide-binding universal stress UspA family protein
MTVDIILVAVGQSNDPHATIAEAAIEVAAPLDATVELLHVYSRSEFETARDELDFEGTPPTPDEVAKRHRHARNVSATLAEVDVETNTRGVVGDYAEKIVSMAVDLDADRIVLGGSGRTPAGKAVFGSTSQSVLLNSPCPVTYVGQDS